MSLINIKASLWRSSIEMSMRERDKKFMMVYMYCITYHSSSFDSTEYAPTGKEMHQLSGGHSDSLLKVEVTP
jgi:hypothetical protein